jgi:hypothetical protein
MMRELVYTYVGIELALMVERLRRDSGGRREAEKRPRPVPPSARHRRASPDQEEWALQR